MADDAQRREEAVRRVMRTGVIAVIRLRSAAGLVAGARALAAGGVDIVEVTMTTPGALEVIAAARRELGDEVLIGAGTVLVREQAEAAVAAGAAFLVSPATDPGGLEVAHAAGIPYVAGALTPNEIQQAMALGADLIKLFPGRVATPGYFRDILGPFPGARLLPTGNVDLTTLPEYLKAGAVAVGVGKALVDPEALAAGDWEAVSARAREYAQAVRSVRGEGR